MCLDPQKHPDIYCMKTFVKALEQIAEAEQAKLKEQAAISKEEPE